jgi:exoribonuclease-2
MTYDAVDAILENPRDRLHGDLTRLYRFAETSWSARLEAGAVAIDRPELQIRVSAEGEIAVDVRRKSTRAQLLVSEMMVFANTVMAAACREAGVPFLYRIQPSADLSDLAGVENDALRRFQMLKRLKPATVSADPGPHGALGVPTYSQTTSPLRRYLDLVCQRQLRSVLSGGAAPYDREALERIWHECAERLRINRRVEARRRRYWLYRYLAAQVGERFEAVVLDASGRECRAETIALGLPITFRPAKPVEPGVRVALSLLRADPWGDEIRFRHEP